MEYSKEDLMEAKKQILGVGENLGTEESKKIWEENAQFWDNAMGDESNEFHREVELGTRVSEAQLEDLIKKQTGKSLDDYIKE